MQPTMQVASDSRPRELRRGGWLDSRCIFMLLWSVGRVDLYAVDIYKTLKRGERMEGSRVCLKSELAALLFSL